MNLSPLFGLFGGKSRVKILKLFVDNEKKQFGVNDVIRKTKINAHLASSELKGLASIGILKFAKVGNSLLYNLDQTSYFTKPLIEIFSEHDWFEWERPSRIHHLILTLEAGLKPMKKYYGYSLPYSHLVFNYDNVTWFFKLSDWKKLGKKLIPIYKKRKKDIWKDFENYASTLDTHKDYLSFYKNYIEFWKVAYITEPISFYIDSLLKPGEQISIQEKSFTDEYENKIWDFAKKAKKIGIEKIDVKPILNEYFWIRNSYYGIHRLTEEEIRTEIRKKLGKVKSNPQKVKDPQSISKDLLEIGKEMVLMQDLRKKYMMKAAYFLHEHLKKIGQKYNLPPAMIVQSLPQEIIHINKRGLKFSDELKLRLRSCTITADIRNGVKVFSGQMFVPEGAEQKAKLEIKGQVACGGKAVGRAKILKQIDEIYKVNHGDVVVSPMTSPELMPALRRCVAIVTNFGGITCHAAIISREFEIPCIVGTKNATEIINDNDLVEVDANSGIVKVIQTSS